MNGSEDSLAIVKAMGEGCLRWYKTFRDGIASNLQPTAEIEGDTFTSHGYDHCVRISRQLNNLLDGHSPFLKDVTPEELFCLSMAVLLHDIVMTKHPNLRKIHSQEAKRIIREEFEHARSSLSGFQLSAPVVDAIADIVGAHSDVKDESGSVVERTLDSIKNKDRAGDTGRIRVYMLSALLRFGDELDCTIQRIQDAQRFLAPEQVAKNRQWRRCELIREIEPPGPSRTNIILNANDLALDESDDRANDLVLIREALEKLVASLAEVNDTVFTPKGIGWWHFNTVKLAPESQKLIASIESQDPLGTAIESESAPSSQPSGVSSGNAVGSPVEADETDGLVSANKATERKLSEWVLDKKMLKSGHFSMSPGRHARDWIDTSQLLEDRRYLGEIVKSFTSILEQQGFLPNNAILIGAGFPGLIIASQIGFIGGYGCSYMVPVHDGRAEEKYSKLPDIPGNKGVVLVTDVVAEGETLKRVLDCLLENYGVSSERVLAILSVFFRRPTGRRPSMADAIKDKLVPLNTEFPIQLCEKVVDDCVLRRHGIVEVINEELGE